jgi:hypothetical protein
VKLVIDIGEATYSATKDISQAFIAMGKETDKVNLRLSYGEKTLGHCQCSGEESHTSTHRCWDCGVLKVCKDLFIDFLGIPTCQKCKKKEPFATRLAIKILHRVITGDLSKTGRSWESPGVEQLISKVEKQIKDAQKDQYHTSFEDAFCGKQRTASEMSTPTALSVDAIFLYGITSSGQAFVHAPGNICLVPMGLNCFKHTMLSVAAQNIAKFSRAQWSYNEALVVGDRSAIEAIETLAQGLLLDCRRFTDIRLKAGHKQISRFSKVLSPAQF